MWIGSSSSGMRGAAAFILRTDQHDAGVGHRDRNNIEVAAAVRLRQPMTRAPSQTRVSWEGSTSAGEDAAAGWQRVPTPGRPVYGSADVRSSW